MEQARERLRVAGIVLVGCLVSPLLLRIGSQLLAFIWLSVEAEHVPGGTDPTLANWRLLAFSLFPVVAGIMGWLSGRFLGRRTWPALLMIWPLFFAVTLAYQDEVIFALLFAVAYAAIAAVSARAAHTLRGPFEQARRTSPGRAGKVSRRR